MLQCSIQVYLLPNSETARRSLHKGICLDAICIRRISHGVNEQLIYGPGMKEQKRVISINSISTFCVLFIFLNTIW